MKPSTPGKTSTEMQKMSNTELRNYLSSLGRNDLVNPLGVLIEVLRRRDHHLLPGDSTAVWLGAWELLTIMILEDK